jgi:hypothetical protein
VTGRGSIYYLSKTRRSERTGHTSSQEHFANNVRHQSRSTETVPVSIQEVVAIGWSSQPRPDSSRGGPVGCAGSIGRRRGGSAGSASWCSNPAADHARLQSQSRGRVELHSSRSATIAHHRRDPARPDDRAPFRDRLEQQHETKERERPTIGRSRCCSGVQPAGCATNRGSGSPRPRSLLRSGIPGSELRPYRHPDPRRPSSRQSRPLHRPRPRSRSRPRRAGG